MTICTCTKYLEGYSEKLLRNRLVLCLLLRVSLSLLPLFVGLLNLFLRTTFVHGCIKTGFTERKGATAREGGLYLPSDIPRSSSLHPPDPYPAYVKGTTCCMYGVRSACVSIDT
jgi:hypothetical protein